MGENPAPWTEADEAIRMTLGILGAVLTEPAALDRIPVVPTMFAPTLVQHDRILVQGPYRRRAWAAGQGVPQLSFTLPGLGGAGVPMPSVPLGDMISTSLAPLNLVLKREKWRPLDAGQLFVSVAGVYFQRPGLLLPWGWSAFTSAQMIGRSQLLVQGTTAGGERVMWIVDSPWAEMFFVLWAAAVHRRHPQLTGGGWIPPGWIDHARAHELFPEEAATAIALALR